MLLVFFTGNSSSLNLSFAHLMKQVVGKRTGCCTEVATLPMHRLRVEYMCVEPIHV